MMGPEEVISAHNAPTAKVIADSITEHGHRLTTLEVRAWRPVLAEINTHRMFSRNSASSRAIPVKKTLQRFIGEFALPLEYPSEQKGMNGGIELTGEDLQDAKDFWDDIACDIWEKTRAYVDAHPDPSTRLHKSLLNRWLEPGLMQTMIISATNWDGFFWQRCHKDAEVHIRVAAEAMRDAINASKPNELCDGDWHLPYWSINGGHSSDWEGAMTIAGQMWDKQDEIAKKCSAARCARVSYMNQDGVRSLKDDLDLYDRLVSTEGGSIYHASPLEHVATPWAGNSQLVYVPGSVDFMGLDTEMGPLPKLGNFVGWCQFRHQELGF